MPIKTTYARDEKMSHDFNRHISEDTMNHMLEYLHDEIRMAKSKEDICAILEIVKTMFSEPSTINTVKGLPSIRAEIRRPPSYNVATNVPKSLVATFYELSETLNQLQDEDPESFRNASKALNWLAGVSRTTN
jgi:hypothetical protein